MWGVLGSAGATEPETPPGLGGVGVGSHRGGGCPWTAGQLCFVPVPPLVVELDKHVGRFGFREEIGQELLP